MIRLDVTLRRPEELQAKEEEILRLQDVIKSKDLEIRKMSDYALSNIKYMDQLKLAKQLLDDAGIDSGFIKLRG